MVTILAIVGAVEAHMMETAKGLFIAIIVLEFVVILTIIIGKVIMRRGHSIYEVILDILFTVYYYISGNRSKA